MAASGLGGMVRRGSGRKAGMVRFGGLGSGQARWSVVRQVLVVLAGAVCGMVRHNEAPDYPALLFIRIRRMAVQIGLEVRLRLETVHPILDTFL